MNIHNIRNKIVNTIHSQMRRLSNLSLSKRLKGDQNNSNNSRHESYKWKEFEIRLDFLYISNDVTCASVFSPGRLYRVSQVSCNIKNRHNSASKSSNQFLKKSSMKI